MARSSVSAAVATLLAALAGIVDALAYLSLGGFFASFMTGNTTKLGVAFVTGNYTDVWTALALILAFVCGVMIAAILAARFPARREAMAMLAVTVTLALAALLAGFTDRQFPLMLLAVAMGAENGVFSRDGKIAIGLTYMTGTLVKFGETLADALIGKGTPLGWVPHLVLWLGFGAGVVIGGHEFEQLGATALWIAAAAAAVMTLLVAALIGRNALEKAQ
jgi:uncharacterized membrane protein YoaK (UPF0700 family)